MLARRDATYSDVVRPYLVGDDIARSPRLAPTRWIIDFGEMALEQAEQWPAAIEIVRSRVKPMRDKHKKARERTQWWKHSRSVRDLFAAIAPLTRFIACPATSKRVMMIWCEPHWIPGNATSAFAYEDNYAYGILTSRIHARWAVLRSTHLKSDPRYTVNSFTTFPWPVSPEGDRAAVAQAGAAIEQMRRALCREHAIGLTSLYNAVDDGAHASLRHLHAELERAVVHAYGWPSEVADDAAEQERRLLELNAELAAGVSDRGPLRRCRR